MSRTIFYIAVLIGIFLIVVYYKGTSNVISTSSSAIGNLVQFLQGRDTKGHITNYPQ